MTYHLLIHVLIILSSFYFIHVLYTCRSVKHAILNVCVAIMSSSDKNFFYTINFKIILIVLFTIVVFNYLVWFNTILYGLNLYFHAWIFWPEHDCLKYYSIFNVTKYHKRKQLQPHIPFVIWLATMITRYHQHK